MNKASKLWEEQQKKDNIENQRVLGDNVIETTIEPEKPGFFKDQEIKPQTEKIYNNQAKTS